MAVTLCGAIPLRQWESGRMARNRLIAPSSRRQTITGPVHGLDVQLIFAFQLHKTHGGIRRCLWNRLRITVIGSFVPLRTDGTYSGDTRRRGVTLSGQQPPEVMRTTASLHRGDTGWHGLRERWNALRSHAPPLHDRSCSTSPRRLQLFFPRSMPRTAISIGTPFSSDRPTQSTRLEKRGGYPIKFCILLKAALPDNIVLLPLPAYSPELNPVENILRIPSRQ